MHAPCVYKAACGGPGVHTLVRQRGKLVAKSVVKVSCLVGGLLFGSARREC